MEFYVIYDFIAKTCAYVLAIPHQRWIKLTFLERGHGREKLPAIVKLTGSRVLGKFYLVISLFAKTDRLELGAQLESHCGPKISYSRAKMKCFYSFKGCSYQTNKVKEQKKMDVQGKLIPSAGRILCMSGLESRVKWPSEGHLNFPRSVTSVLSSKLIKV